MLAMAMDGGGADQFRQIMSWALSQTLAVTPNQVSSGK